MASSDRERKEYINQYGRKVTNICADCTYPIKDCPWLHKGEAVPGWDAKRVQWSSYKEVYTYSIQSCPLFMKCKRKRIGRGL